MPRLGNSVKIKGSALTRGHNEEPCVSLCKQKSKTWETYLAWLCYKSKVYVEVIYPSAYK